MEQPVSLQVSMTEHWEKSREVAMRTVELADRNLARIGLIYSGQLSLKLLEDDIPPEASAA